MSWFKNPFKKKEAPVAGATPVAPYGPVPGPGGIPQLPPELANDPKMKGMMGTFFRKWKDPVFLRQLRVLAVHIQRDGVDIKDMKAVSTWLEKNKERVEKGDFKEEAAKPGATFIKTGPEVGRNDPCHCGSGKKFKKCHGSGS